MRSEEIILKLLEINMGSISALWGYYFTILIGGVAFLGGMLGGERKLSLTSALALSVLLIVFGASNWFSIYAASETTKRYLDALNDPNVRALVGDSAYSTWSLYLHPVGVAALCLFVMTRR